MFILLKTDHNNQNTANHRSAAVSSGCSRFDEPQWYFFRAQSIRCTLLSTEFGHFDVLVGCFDTFSCSMWDCCEIIITGIYYYLFTVTQSTTCKVICAINRRL